MAPAPVTVLILSPVPDAGAGPLTRVLDEARSALAEHHRVAFLAAGAASVRVHREPPDDIPFGTRLRRLVESQRPAGLVVLGAGSIPLATPADLRDLVAAAATTGGPALANQRFSADVVAIPDAMDALRQLPADLAGDNALPRWLEEVAGVAVRDLHARRRLAVDVDSPLDLLLIEGRVGRLSLPVPRDGAEARVRRALGRLRAVAADPGGELLVAGRLAASDLRWLERNTRARTRALIEERGLRTASLAASLGRPNRRAPWSILGELLDRDGPGSLGRHVASLSDGALIDSRVLLAHRLGADESRWPAPEDRYASDLLLPEAVGDPWLRELTEAAADAPVPVLIGAHTLVGPGARLALRARGKHRTTGQDRTTG